MHGPGVLSIPFHCVVSELTHGDVAKGREKFTQNVIAPVAIETRQYSVKV